MLVSKLEMGFNCKNKAILMIFSNVSSERYEDFGNQWLELEGLFFVFLSFSAVGGFPEANGTLLPITLT